MALSLKDKDQTAAHLYRDFMNSDARLLNISRHGMEARVSELIREIFVLFFPDQSLVREHNEEISRCFTKQLENIERLLMNTIHPVACTNAPESESSSLCKDYTEQLIMKLPQIRKNIGCDVQAAMEGDPAASSYDEVVMAYPGVFAVTVYRVAHELYNQGVRLLARMMTEQAHSLTGIDMHPGARIGKGFFIDHATGVVIGETCEIGDYVKIYQGVTLGALSIPKDTSTQPLGVKRHPTIKDHVTIYAGATILGGETVIGEHSLIGGNVWCTQSIPPYSKVINRPSVEYR